MGNSSTTPAGTMLSQMDDAKNSGRLILSDMKLEELPVLEDNIEIHTLEIDHNLLRSLPEPLIQRLGFLVVLNASYNSISSLPSSFTNLTSLMKLDLSHNSLKALDNLKPTPTLQILYAGHNRIETLPADLDKLVSLQVLDLNHNLISDITLLRHLHHVISLDLGHNGIKEIPTQLFTLHNVEVLNLQNNAIETIPKGIIKMRKLMFLFLQSNKLKTIPSDIGDLQYLEELNLRDNEINMLPLTLGKQISHLKVLKLEGIPSLTVRKQGTQAVLSYLSMEKDALDQLKVERQKKKGMQVN